ncbi:T6SS effector amidase Tae4 family protein [Thalassomonas actiniarum]|uniref:T6SS effector amidase Tae4 family protein n=1 Tax=Thalassomonas actiniarum TaxID=485447 RepID=UPI00069FEBE1|nr:T6SS effector amidase Tae4 family protein [Thalassomonas actiniarum]
MHFQKLWDNHPTILGQDNPCSTDGSPNFSNQCAIKLGVALARCGVVTSSFPGATHCWHGHNKSEGHIIRAEELANALDRFTVAGIQKLQKINPKIILKK